MKVILAGYNLDSGVIEELKRNSPPRADVTPETLSAAYARISRDPRPADRLRLEARAEVERARRSNRNIIFKMGHHSVAEHAVFNFDLIGVSRLAVEAVEHFRLCSFTEKSQRYITLGDDFVVPEEVRRAGLEEKFVATVRRQNRLYHELYGRLKPLVFEKHREAAAEPKNHAVLEGWAKEDARYIVSLATEGQLGMTVNARNLELLLRRFASAGLEELRAVGRALYEQVTPVAPSIVLFTEANDLDARMYGELLEAAEASGLTRPGGRGRARKKPARTSLAAWTPDGDSRVLAALLHSVSGLDYSRCFKRVKAAPAAARKKLMLEAFEHMEFYDPPPREFEHAELVFELVVSASCFAQLKRHRLATLTVQRYDPALGVTVPPSVAEAGLEREFREVIAETERTHRELRGRVGEAADYVLTNSHRRRVLLKVNLRELYHVSRLREDASAQWEIREVAGEMSAAARRAFPLAGLLLGGKDAYPGIYARVFGRPPRAVPPRILTGR
jgi:flavin-dependent thymidylate synthase